MRRRPRTGTAVYPYPRRDRRAPACSPKRRELEPDWALQDPEDYVRTFQQAVPALLAVTGVDPADVIGLGIDFTACTMLPSTATGRRCACRGMGGQPARLGQAVEAPCGPARSGPNERDCRRARGFFPRYGGKISSEWLFAKALQILDEAPEIYRADRLFEAADWVVWQLTGTRRAIAARPATRRSGPRAKAILRNAFFAALDPRLEHVVDRSCRGDIAARHRRAD